MVATGVQAQDSTQRVEVTGSNVPRTDKETASPVQVLTATDLKNSGYTTVSEVLRDITANGQGTLAMGFNQAFAGGASGVSLRGLTVGNTLVLIDGYRMAPYPLSDDGQRPFVDISSIPLSAVDRIEVLKDGASAVYGSDAIAGVVNVILKRHNNGTLLSIEGGTTQHGGGTTAYAAITQGFAGASDPLNGFVSFEYRKQNEIRLDQRSGRDWTNFDWRFQGGEDLRPGARNAFAGTPRLAVPYLQRPGGAAANPADFAFSYGGCDHANMRANNCTFTNTWAQLQPETENLNLIGRLNAKIAPDWNASLTASWFDSKSDQVRRPENIPFGSFGGITAIGPGLTPTVVSVFPNFTVPATYPGNPFGVAANVRGILPGILPRIDDFDSKSTRLVAELDGSVAGWYLKAAAGYTKVTTEQTFHNYINYPNLLAALNDPVNPYLLSGGNSQALNDFVTPTVTAKATDELDFVSVRGSRELTTLDGGPLGLGLGAEFRYKKLNAPDPLPAQQGTMGLNGAYAVGTEKVSSAYVELVAPVMKTLELDGALRFDHYDTFGSNTTPKIGFKYTPMKEFAVRGTAGKGFRAPSATENGTAGSLFAFNAIRDPALCPISNPDGSANLTAAGNVPAFCSFNPTYLQGTSQNLKPEKSTNYTLGLIVEPIANWSTTLDYYNISIKDQIIPAAALATFDPLLYVVRTTPQQVTFGDGSTGLSSVGPIQYVNTPYVNGQETKTSGIDFETRYKWGLGDAGNLTTGLMWTYIINYDMTVNGITYKLAGTHGPSIIGGNTGNPKNRGQLSFVYDLGPFTSSVMVNYVGSFDVTDPSTGFNDCASAITGYNSQFAATGIVPDQYCKVKSFTYVNLAARYAVNKQLTIRGAIQNLFDKDPPIDMQTYGGTGSNSSSNGTGAPYNPSMHQAGAIGRFFSLGLDYAF